VRGSGPRTRRLRSILKRRERTAPERRPALDARGLGLLARPLAIVYTDTDDFTHRAARDGILHFLMCFDRALRHVRPAIARSGGRVVKVEADSLMLAFPDPPSACRGVDAMEQALRRVNRGRPTNEQVAFSYGIGFLELEDDVFGLEVNLASKLGEDLARPGEVLLTPSAAETLPARLRRRLVRYGQVGFAGRPMPVERLRPRGSSSAI
jgi:adenylate cyclase